MFNVSDAYKTAIVQPSRIIKASVGIGDKSITNLVLNGDFNNGLTNWNAMTSYTDTQMGAVGQLTRTNWVSGNPRYQATQVTANLKLFAPLDKIYMGYYVYVDSSVPLDASANNNTAFRVYNASNVSTDACVIDFKPTITNKWTYLSALSTLPSDANPNNMQPSLLFSLSQNGLVRFDNIILLNLTALYGAGNEPSKAYIDELISKVGWFDGNKNVPLQFLDNRILNSMVTNGDFSNGTSGWTGIDAVVSGIAEKTATAQYQTIGYTTLNPTTRRGHKIYASALVKSDSVLVALTISDAISLSQTSHTGDNTFKTLSVIRTIDNSATNVYCRIQDNRASGWTKYYADNIIMIDLTESYGAGKEPTQAYMDTLVASSGWFNSYQFLPSQTSENTVLQSFSTESSFGSNNLPTIGSTVSNKLVLSLVNDTRIPQVLTNVTIRPYSAVDIGSGVYEWVEHGEFYADYGDVVKNKMTTNIEGFDRLSYYDGLEYESDLDFTNPVTLTSIATEMKTKWGVDFTTTTLATFLSTIKFSIKPTGTVRQVIGLMASYMSTNATMTEHGQVDFRFLATSGFSLDKSNYSEFKLLSDAPIKISQLILKQTDGTDSVAYGDSSGFALEFVNDEVKDEELDTIFNRAFYVGSVPFTYYSYQMKSQGMPHLQIGDTISFSYVKNDGTVSSVITLPILSHKFTFNGGMSSEFTAEAPKQKTTSMTLTGGSSVDTAVKQNYKNMQDALSNAVRQLSGNQGGYIITVLNADGQPQELVVSDTPDLNSPDAKMWVWNANGLGFSNSGYHPNDPSAYTVAMTSDGQIVANMITTGEMSAERVTTGKLQDVTGLSWIDLDNGKFSLGGGALAWDGSALSILYEGTDLGSAIDSKADSTRVDLYENNVIINGSGITIGKTDSPFKVNIDNQSVEFLDYGNGIGGYTPDPNAVAYITGKKMFITDLQTTNSIQVGNHQIIKYDADITLIKYVG